MFLAAPLNNYFKACRKDRLHQGKLKGFNILRGISPDFLLPHPNSHSLSLPTYVHFAFLCAGRHSDGYESSSFSRLEREPLSRHLLSHELPQTTVTGSRRCEGSATTVPAISSAARQYVNSVQCFARERRTFVAASESRSFRRFVGRRRHLLRRRRRRTSVSLSPPPCGTCCVRWPPLRLPSACGCGGVCGNKKCRME